MGEVYEAQRTSDGSPVALKLSSSGGQLPPDSDAIRRFHREAAICVKLRHRNVIPVIDYGIFEQAIPFLVMPVLVGRDLERTISETNGGGPLHPNVAIAIALGCARGLDAAHQAGVIHRDLKPANIFLDEDPRTGTITPIVCDFGVAKAVHGFGQNQHRSESDLTATGAVLGTPLFMAPEQLLDSKNIDERCDVWSFGMTLYFALAGKPAFDKVQTLSDLLVALRTAKLTPLQKLAPWIPGPLARAVHAMLLPYEDRIISIAEVINVLEKVAIPAALTRSTIVPLPAEAKAVHAPVVILPRTASELTAFATPDSGGAAGGDIGTDKTIPVVGDDPFVGRTLNDRFRFIAPLGTGGMGAVYDAIDLTSSQSVAIKVMTSKSDGEDGLRRFLREAKAASRIQSAHVTTTIDSGIDATTGVPYIVMERLRGKDLAEVIRKQGALDPAPVVRLFLDACSALSAAHTLGIVHRDVKPSNLFVHEEEASSVLLKICDFGIAKQLEPTEATADLTRTGGLLGSPLYMSPEQAKSAKYVDARSDVYSLSLSLYEALSGRRPWEGRTSMGEIIVAICTEDLPPLEHLAPWLPQGLVQAIRRGLEKDASVRWPSIQDFASAIRPFAMTERPVRMSDLVGLPSERRTSASSSSSSSSSNIGVESFRGRTGSPVSLTSGTQAPKKTSSRSAFAVASALALAFCMMGGVAWFAQKHRENKTQSAEVPTTSASSTTLIAVSPPPPPAASSSVVVGEESETDASVPQPAAVTTKPIAVISKPKPAEPAIASASPSAVPSASSSSSTNFGRGLTAPTLPGWGK
jgi:eukaryotic-like serine/threonine-protein kinase